MPSSSQDQQPTALLWLGAVLFCDQAQEAARAVILDGGISVNGHVVYDPLMQIHSGDILFKQPTPRPVDLYALRKANGLRRQIEGFL